MQYTTDKENIYVHCFDINDLQLCTNFAYANSTSNYSGKGWIENAHFYNKTCVTKAGTTEDIEPPKKLKPLNILVSGYLAK
jgi:hypothetical protein